MDIKTVGTRGIMVTYHDLVDTEFSCTTNIYLINAANGAVLVDTFLGPDIMDETFRALDQDPALVRAVINTHSDWDHIWGNSFFPGAQTIAHTNFSDLVVYPDSPDFGELRQYARGPVRVTEPSITFDSRLTLPGLGLEVFYTPGHSADSISVYDQKDRILIVGDNCEIPIPSYMDAGLLEEHLASLVHYLEFDFEYIVPGHGGIMTRQDLLRNIQYLEDLIRGDEAVLARYLEGACKMNHLTNLLYMGEQRATKPPAE